MKAQKTITIITIILLILIISLASFLGIYKKEEYRVTNILPKYVLGMEFTNKRVVNLELEKKEETEVAENTENNQETNQVESQNNFKKSVKILKNRLKNLGVDEYRVVLDKSNGNIQIRIPESNDVSHTIYHMLQSGTFELKDSETGETLIDTNCFSKANVVYGQTETETGVYLQINLNKEGKQKLKEISKVYVKNTVQTENDEGETEETEEIKKVAVYLNGELYRETYFGSEIDNGILNVIVGAGTDAEAIKEYAEEATEMAGILNSGVLPLAYTQTDYVEESNITSKYINIAIYVALAVTALMVLFLIIKLRTKGLLASVLHIGFIALLLLVLRWTNVKITIEGICGIIIGIVINYIYIYIAFKNMDLDFIKDITAKYALKLIPIYVIAVILSFNKLANIYSIGMTIVWSTIVMYIYNLCLTRNYVTNNKKRTKIDNKS